MNIRTPLTKLSEDKLREEIMIPLLNALGAYKTESMCGPNEKGKDVYFAYKDLFGLYKHCCLFIKKGDVKKSGKNDIRKMRGSLQEAIMSDFSSPIDSKTKIHIDEFYFVCSGKINGQARDYLSEFCGKRSMPNFRVFDIDDLVKFIIELIDGNTYSFHIKTFKNFCEGMSPRIGRKGGTISATLVSEGEAVTDNG